MARIQQETALTFDDVVLVPQYSEVLSRKTVSAATHVGMHGLAIPILSANMDTVTGLQMVQSMLALGGQGVLHRFASFDEQLLWVERLGACAVPSIGVHKDDWDRAVAFRKHTSSICVDIAHGHNKLAGDTVRHVRNLGFTTIIAGNVATADGAEYLITSGANVVKVGVGPGCFAAGTRVLMADATYKNIEDIKAGDRVINMHGTPVTVVKAWCTGIRDVVSVRHTASARETVVTPDHQFFVGDLSSVTARTVSNQGYATILNKKTKRETSKIKWTKIQDAQRAALLAPRNISYELPETFNLNVRDFSVRDGDLRRYNLNISPSYDLGYLFGTFLGDGCASVAVQEHTTTGAVHWYFGRSEQQIIDKLVTAVERVTGVKPTVSPENKGCIHVNLYSLQWAHLLHEFGKKDLKHLPSKYWCSDLAYLEGIFDGLVDSDGNIEASGRVCFKNTSQRLAELFGILCQLLKGTFPEASVSKGDLFTDRPNFKSGPCKDAYRSRLNSTHLKRLLPDFQIVKKLDYTLLSIVVPVYDIEVDCETHSFIANNVIVHNSLCSTRVVTGHGYPQLSAIMEVAARLRDYPFVSLVADGGIRNSGDIVKSLAAGADAVMIGGLFAGCDETPGELLPLKNGKQQKLYRGSASESAQKASRGFVSNDAPEGEHMYVDAKGPVKGIVANLMGGLRSGMSYAGAFTIQELQEKAVFACITSNGLAEGRPHGIRHD